MTVDRLRLREQIGSALRRSRGVVLVGPRQVGKTTLAREFVAESRGHYFDLEDPQVEAQFEAPRLVLERLEGLVAIDEVQRAPELFKLLRVLMDRSPLPAKFLLLGSASPGLLRQTSESLAGRVEVIEIGGFTLDECGPEAQRRLWLRGGYPLSYLAASDTDSREWRRAFTSLFLERDLPQLGINVPAPAMRRFWTMLAHLSGQVWNAAEPARSLGVNESTARRYLDWLTQTFMVRQLQPWFANVGKRQVKAPKIYFRDSGLLHQLLGIGSEAALLAHPKSGASWEGFALEQTLCIAAPDEAWFWATHTGAELDLLMVKDGRRVGVEFKRMDAPRLTPSMRIALQDLDLEALYIVYPGNRRYALAERVEAVPLQALVPRP